MGSKQDPANKRLRTLLQSGKVDKGLAALKVKLTDADRAALHEILTLLRDSPGTAMDWSQVAESLVSLSPDADGFAALAGSLEKNGAKPAADAALRFAGQLDFVAEPEMDVWGGAFNGQEGRQGIFEQLLEVLKVTAIVETGTFRGTSTAYMAKFGLPLYSCELNPRYFRYASQRLSPLANVHLTLSDSRPFLRGLFDQKTLPNGTVLFYLDAHWESDLPLWEEIDLIFSHSPQAVIMVDDFRVPTDSGFSYDDYGRGKCLSVSNLYAAAVIRPSLFFPSSPSGHETGATRGCVVLAIGDTATAVELRASRLTGLAWDKALSYDGVADVMAKLQAEIAEAAANRADTRSAAAETKITMAETKIAVAETKIDVAETKIGLAETRAAIADLKAQVTAATLDLQVQVALVRDELRQQAAANVVEVQLGLAEVKVMVQSLHDEIRTARAEAGRIEKLERYIDRILYTRWRHLGIRLGLEKKVTIE
jgi:predicted O-methyltransferase YrrM